jgi:hypothetical protein
MRAKTLTTPSDAPCPGIGWLVLPARDRIISQRERMSEGAFDLLKTGYSQPRSAQQPEFGLTALRTILSIRVVELTLPGSRPAGLQPVLAMERAPVEMGAGRRPGSWAAGSSPRKSASMRRVSGINHYDCLFFMLGLGRAQFSTGRTDLVFSSPHFRPTTFPDLFGPVADIPHIEGIRGVHTFVFLTCVI